MKKIKTIFILSVFTILSGCASITEFQSMSVTTGEVVGAMCTLSVIM